MKAKELLSLLIQNGSKDRAHALASKMPKELQKEVLETEADVKDLHFLFTPPEDQVAKVHYSWFLPLIESLSKETVPLAIGALPEPQHTKILKTLEKVKVKPLSLMARRYFLHYWLQDFFPSNLLPIEVLSQKNPLYPLLTISRDTLLHLFDYLGLYDLAIEMRRIVDKQRLVRVGDALTPSKRHFLQMAMQQKERMTAKPLDLKQWDGDAKKLKRLVHERGLARLGGAVSGQSLHFVWHLTHYLDKGRAERFLKHYRPERSGEIRTLLTQQVVAVLDYFEMRERR